MIVKNSDGEIFIDQPSKSPSKYITHKKANKKAKKASKLLILCSILSPIIAIAIVCILKLVNSFFIGNMWIFYFFSPIPALSILFGVLMKQVGIGFKKNIVCGIITLVLLVVVGTLPFFLKDKYTKSDKHVLKAEKIIGFDIPEYSYVETWSCDDKISNGHAYYACEAGFDSEKAQNLEEFIKTEDIWLSVIPDSMLEIVSPSFYLQSDVDYTLIYNETKNEINVAPIESGTYDFLCIMYDMEKHEMEIVEYKIDYVK